MGVPCCWLVSVRYREIISENGSFRCWEFSCPTSMPKWRTVSFVAGVTLNIGDSTSLRWSKIIFYANDIFCNIKKRFWNTDLSSLGSCFLFCFKLRYIWMKNSMKLLNPIATYRSLDLGPNKIGTLLWSSGVRQTRPQFLSTLSIITNWTGEQLTPRKKYHNMWNKWGFWHHGRICLASISSF